MEPDFSGYVTKAGLKCTDGRTIMPDAFKHQDKAKVPLVWQHQHDGADNILGHMMLEARTDGMYGEAFLNDAPQGKNARTIVQHGDIEFMSIWANNLHEKAMQGNKQVFHGDIREVSLVMAGANPGAKIDYIRIEHGDGDITQSSDEAVITTGIPFDNSTQSKEEAVITHAAGDDRTVQDVLDTMNDEQKTVLEYMIAQALSSSDTAEHSALGDDATPQDVYDAFDDRQREVVSYLVEQAVEKGKATVEHSALADNKEGIEMTNVFEKNGGGTQTVERPTLSHDQMKTIVEDAVKSGGKLSESFLAHAGTDMDYGIEDIDLLFPDATLDSNGVSIISRRMEWVQNVLSTTKHSPFSRIKSIAADITADEARAKGYVKGTKKKDEIIRLLKRVTTPKTIYKKQKLDRDDIIDITTVDVVAWLKAEMRVMLDEEIARAILIGDGRDADDEDKIDEDHIRPVAYDDDMYTEKVKLTSDMAPEDTVDAVVTALDAYKGTGQPTLYTTQKRLTKMLLARDGQKRRLYPTKADLAAAMLVKDIVPVEAMEEYPDLFGVLVNLADYTVGADRGGEISMFDDFDIDYNQQKYLIETRISGCLTKPKSAIALQLDDAHMVSPQAPTFNESTGVVTIPSQAHVTYKNRDTGATLSSGPQTALQPRQTLKVEAVPADGYGLVHGVEKDFDFTRPGS